MRGQAFLTSSLVFLASLSSGCECADDEPSFTAAPPPREGAPREEAPAPVELIPGATSPGALAPATRTDLPPADPAITVRLDGDAVIVTNEGLVASWPPADRERLATAPPAGASAGFPMVTFETSLEATASEMGPSDVTAALRRAIDAERMRSGTGAPTAVALRVTGTTPWSSVLRVLFATGMAGLSEPRFVLTSGREDVELRLPVARAEAPSALPGPMAGRDPAEVIAAIQQALAAHPREAIEAQPRAEIAPSLAPGASALAGAEPGAEPSAAVPAGAAASGPVTITVHLGRDGLVVTRGAERLGTGCQRAAIGAAPSLPSASLTVGALRDCLATAGATSLPYAFEAEREVTFARVAPILETLDDVGSVTIGVPL